MSKTINSQFRSVIQWTNPDPEMLFEQWTEKGDEIMNASKLIVGPGQGCLFVYEGKVEGVFVEEGVYDLETENIPFWTTVKSILYKFESFHKAGIYYFRKADIVNKRWGTSSLITYSDPKFKFPVSLGAFGNFSFRIINPIQFFRNIVAGANKYSVREIQNVFVSRITQPLSDYLANAQFGFIEIDKHRNEIANSAKSSSFLIFKELGFELIDFRIEGTNFSQETQERIARIADFSAEAQAIKELGIDYAHYQQLQALRDMAKNEAQPNQGFQMGIGMEMGKLFGNMINPTPSHQINSAPPSNSTDDAIARLEKLKKMYEMSLINEQEYTTKKQEILSQL